MITTVVFDLDDTLCDEIDFCRSGFRAAAPHIAALSDAHSADAVFDTLWKCFITGDCGSTFNVALAQLGIPRDGPLMHKLVEVYLADNETKDFIAPNRLGLLTIQLLRPSGLYREPSPRADAAPRVKIAAIGELTGVLARFAQCP
jgi:FMN phosphatase YigB (HAD superfamily)